MIFALVPREATEDDTRMFATFSAAEYVVKQGIAKRRVINQSVDWCYLIAYDGVDELFACFVYVIGPGDHLVRKPIQSPSGS